MTVTRQDRNPCSAYSGVVTATLPGQSDPVGRDAELVIAFLNTVDEELHTDVLDREESWQRWAREHGRHRVDTTSTAREVRQALRTAITGGTPPNMVAPQIRVDLGSGVPVLVGDTTVGSILAAAARLAAMGEWNRIKICPADNCRWAFHDDSRNRSRAWCSMRICGNREKARNWRRRNQDSGKPRHRGGNTAPGLPSQPDRAR